MRLVYFPADIEITQVDHTAPIGIFGVFNSLTVSFTEKLPENFRILVQDLTTDFSIDVTSYVYSDGEKLVLDGKKLRFWGKSSRGIGDNSYPSLMLKVENLI